MSTPIERAAAEVRAHKPKMFDCSCGAEFGGEFTPGDAARQFRLHVAHEVVSAALTDPDDPDWLARGMIRAHSREGRWDDENAECLCGWEASEFDGDGQHAAHVADAIRGAILGESA